MNITALLPMKGHSERIPNKNIKEFNCKPLYHSIANTLEQCDYIGTIIINTDSEIIAENALKNFSKVKIHWRPLEIQGDFVSMNEIIKFDLENFDKTEHFLQTHSTNPLLSLSTINKAIEFYFSTLEIGYDSLFSVTKHQSRFYSIKGKAINHNINQLIRTQDLEPLYEENSNLYIFSKTSFFNSGYKRIGVKPMLFETKFMESIDIDNISDFKLAEAIAKI